MAESHAEDQLSKVPDESQAALVLAQTRSKTHVWLVGQQLNVLDGLSCSNRLPTTEQVLGRLFYDLKKKQILSLDKLF